MANRKIISCTTLSCLCINNDYDNDDDDDKAEEEEER